MKKTLRILASAVLAASMLFAVGCAKDVGSASVEKVKKWDNGNIQHGAGVIRLYADDYDINWWVMTDMNGRVLNQDTDNFKVTEYTGNDKNRTTMDNKPESEYNTPFTYRNPIKQGKTVHIKFNGITDNKDIIFWVDYANTKKMAKDPNTDKDVPYSDLTVRGTIDVSPTTGTLLKASGVPEAVRPMGTVTVKCTETAHCGRAVPAGTTAKKWHGNYKINEIWPLTPATGVTADKKFEAVDNLKIKKLNIEEGKQAEVIFPISASYVAVKQDERFRPDLVPAKHDPYGNTGPEEYHGAAWKTVEEQASKDQKDWYWCAPTEIAKKNGTTAEIIKTSDCTHYFKTTDGSITAGYAYVPPIIIDSADIVDGADLK